MIARQARSNRWRLPRCRRCAGPLVRGATSAVDAVAAQPRGAAARGRRDERGGRVRGRAGARATPVRSTRPSRRAGPVGPAPRAADHGEGLDRRRGLPVRGRGGARPGPPARAGRDGGGPAAGRGRGRGGEDAAVDGDGAAGASIPLDPTRSVGGFEQRRGGGRRDGRIAPGDRQRLGRQHPAAGGVVRRVRPQADRRPGADHGALPAGRRAERRPHADRPAGAAASTGSSRRCAVMAGPDWRDAGRGAGAAGAVRCGRPARAAHRGRRRASGTGCSPRSRPRWTRAAAALEAAGAARVPWIDALARRGAGHHPALLGAVRARPAPRPSVSCGTGTATGAGTCGPRSTSTWCSARPPRRPRRSTGRSTGEDFVFTLPASLTGSPAVVGARRDATMRGCP